MSEKIKKQRMTLRLDPEIQQTVKEMYRQDGCTTMSQFYEKAIRYYARYLTAENREDYLPKDFLQSMREIIKERDDNLGKGLFPIAVETTMVENIVANLHRYDPEEVRQLREESEYEVKCVNGILRVDR